MVRLQSSTWATRRSVAAAKNPDIAVTHVGVTTAAPTMAEPLTNCLRSMT